MWDRNLHDSDFDANPEEDLLDSPSKRKYSKYLVTRDWKVESRRLRRISEAEHNKRFEELLDEKSKLTKAEHLPYYILNPRSSTRITWDLILLIMLIYIAVVTPFRIGFDQPALGVWLILETALDVLFLADVVVNFFTAVQKNPSDTHLIYDLRTIAKRYLLGFFAIDIFSSIPFDLIVHYSGQYNSMSGADSAKTLKSSKVVRMLRIAKFSKLARLTRGVAIFRRTVDYINLAGHFFFTIAKIVVLTLFIGHLVACGFGMIATFDSTTYPDSWMHDWDRSLETDSVSRKYLASLYFAYCLMISGEGGGMGPTNDLELIFTLFVAVVTGMYYLYVVATVTTLMTSADMKNLQYRENIDNVLFYMKQRKFPKELFIKVLRFYKHFYSNHTETNQETKILGNMNMELKREVTHFLSSGIFKNTHLFADFHEDVHATILSILRPMEVEMGDAVFRAGDAGSEIYIIRNGHVRGLVPRITLKARQTIVTSASQKGNAGSRLRAAIGKLALVKDATGITSKIAPVANDERDESSQSKVAEKKENDVVTGTLFDLVDGMLFGEFCALDVVPKRIYDAVAVRRTEMFYLTRKDFLETFDDADEYVVEHATTIARRHLSYIKRMSKTARLAVEMFGRVDKTNYSPKNNRDDNKKTCKDDTKKDESKERTTENVVTCQKGCVMRKLTSSPSRAEYKGQLIHCDECNEGDLVRTSPHFYHCEACCYDLCAKCASKQVQQSASLRFGKLFTTDATKTTLKAMKKVTKKALDTKTRRASNAFLNLVSTTRKGLPPSSRHPHQRSAFANVTALVKTKGNMTTESTKPCIKEDDVAVLEKRIETMLETFNARLTARVSEMEKRLSSRIDELESEILTGDVAL